MAKSRLMDPRYAKAIKSTEELFTPIELQQMNIDPKNMIKTIRCNPYFESNYKDKNKLKNTFIINSEAGLYEFFAKEVECIKDFREQKKELKNSFVKTVKPDEIYTEEQKREQLRKLVEYEKEMDLLFRNLSRICQNKAKGLCGIRDKSKDDYSPEKLTELMINEKGGKIDENEIKKKIKSLNDDQLIEAIKTRNPRFKELLKMSDDELGSGRKMLLMLNGFKKVGQGWKYSKELEAKFVEAASICRKNNLCIKSEFSDIPKEIGRFTEEILDGIIKPYDYMFGKSMDMFGVSKQKAIERQKEKKQKLGDKIKRLEKEKEALASEKEKAQAKLNETNLSKSERKKTEAKIAKIQKRENRIEKGQTISPRRLTFRNKNSLQTLQIKKSDAEYREKRKGKELERMKERKSSDYLNRISKITPERLKEKQKLTNAVKDVEQKRLNKKIDLIEKKKDSETGLTGSQKRDLEGRIYKKSLKTRRKKAETSNQKIERLTKKKAEILERIKTGDAQPGDYARLQRITKGVSSFRSPFTKNGFRLPFTKKNSLGKLEGKNIKTKRLERRKELYEALKTKKGFRGLTDNEQKQYKQLTQGDKLKVIGLGKKSVYELQGLTRGESKMKRIQNNLNILHAQKGRTNINESQKKAIDNKIKKIQGRLNPTGNKLVGQIRENAIKSVKEKRLLEKLQKHNFI